ncbi:MAG: hypothetical protein C0522_15195, partial [Rhodocyclaceae bacterium]|nr:hypothetical protein [Rhodocyclaceae bacterium]
MTDTPPSARLGLARVTLGLAVAAVCVLAWSLTVPAETGPHAPVPGASAETREGIWRAIFARPAPGETVPARPELIALGRDLFRDTRLSGSGQASCVSCHDP